MSVMSCSAPRPLAQVPRSVTERVSQAASHSLRRASGASGLLDGVSAQSVQAVGR